MIETERRGAKRLDRRERGEAPTSERRAFDFTVNSKARMLALDFKVRINLNRILHTTLFSHFAWLEIDLSLDLLATTFFIPNLRHRD